MPRPKQVHSNNANRWAFGQSMKRKMLVLGIISIFIVSCSFETEDQYTLFTPNNESYFKVTFEYPSDWEWEILDNELSVVSAIMKIGSQAQEIQTPNPAICHDETHITVVVVIDKNPQTVLTARKNAIQYGVDVTKVWKIQNREEFKIDGFPAIKIVGKDEPLPIDPFAHCASEIDITTIYFLMASDRFYEFTFSASENEQDTEFYRDFIHLVSTINVVP